MQNVTLNAAYLYGVDVINRRPQSPGRPCIDGQTCQ